MTKVLVIFFLLFPLSNSFSDLINHSPSYVNLFNNAQNFEASIYLDSDDRNNFKNETYSVFGDKIMFFETKPTFKKYQSKELNTSEIFTNLYSFNIEDKDKFENNPITLLFKKNYNTNWKLFYSNENFKDKKIDFYFFYLKNFIFNSKSSFKQFAAHRHANYVLNAWTIDDKSIQLLDNNFYIFYQPQIFYELGLFLSFLIAVSSIIFIIFFYIRSIIFIKFLNAKK